jgi:hypothetical protein
VNHLRGFRIVDAGRRSRGQENFNTRPIRWYCRSRSSVGTNTCAKSASLWRRLHVVRCRDSVEALPHTVARHESQFQIEVAVSSSGVLRLPAIRQATTSRLSWDSLVRREMHRTSAPQPLASGAGQDWLNRPCKNYAQIGQLLQNRVYTHNPQKRGMESAELCKCLGHATRGGGILPSVYTYPSWV